MEDVEVSMWDKDQMDLTSGEAVKQAVAVAVVVTVIPLAIYGIIFGGIVGWNKIQERRKLKKEIEALSVVQ